SCRLVSVSTLVVCPSPCWSQRPRARTRLSLAVATQRQSCRFWPARARGLDADGRIGARGRHCSAPGSRLLPTFDESSAAIIATPPGQDLGPARGRGTIRRSGPPTFERTARLARPMPVLGARPIHSILPPAADAP